MADEMTKIAQESARGSFFLVFGSAFSTIILAITSIIVARILGAELYGQYALALVIPQILFLLTDLGISQGITKFVSVLKTKNEFNRLNSIVKHGLLVRICMGLAIFGITFFFADFMALFLLQRLELAFYIRIASLSIIFQVIFTTATSVFVGFDKTEYQAISINIQAIFKAIISIVLVLSGFNILGALIGHTVSYIVTAIIGIPLIWILLKKKGKISNETNIRRNLHMLFQYGAPLYISGLIAGFLPLFKNMILAFFVTDSDIGNYKAALNFIAVLIILAGPINVMLLPAFSKLNQNAKQKVAEFFQIAVKYTSMIMLPVAFLIILFSTEIVWVIYGEAFASAPLFLSTYSLVYLLVGAGYLTLPGLFNGLGETRITLKMWMIRSIILILLVVPLTQTYGVLGLIVSFLLSMASGSFYGAREARNKLQIEFDIRNTSKIYFVAIFSGIIPLILSNLLEMSFIINLLIGSILYLGIYITLLPLVKVITRLELEKIQLATRNSPILKQLIKPILYYEKMILRLLVFNEKDEIGLKTD